MNYHIITDTHFNHTKLESWGGRSGGWQDELMLGMHEVPETDIIIHLGDICIGNDESVHREMHTLVHAKRILVRGNHDRKSIQWYYDHGWDFVCDSFELLYNGHYLYFSHKPQPRMGHFTKNIHGHTHGTMHHSEEYIHFYDKGYHVDMSPELVGYKPIRLDTLLKKKL